MARSAIRRGALLVVAAFAAACSGSPSQSGLVAPSSLSSLTAQPGTLLNLNVIRVGTGSGSVTSDPAGISCPRRCSASFLPGTEVTLTATPDKQSEFAGWTDACLAAGSNPVATVTMDVQKYCTVTFNKKAGPPPPTGGPDLVAAFGYFSSGPRGASSIACPGVNTTNQGDGPADASTTRVLFSLDGIPDAGDEVLWTVAVPPLLPGVVDRQIADPENQNGGPAFCFTIPSARGTYYYFVIADVDDAVPEIDEANNVRTYSVKVR